MTREEAVEVLKERYLTCVGIGLDHHANRVNEAIDMAIEALSAETSQNLAKPNKALKGSDLIRRADAIKAVEQEYKIDRGYMADDYTYGFNQAIQYVSDIILQDLPSADAVSREDTVTLNSPISIQAEMVAVVRCKDCIHYESDGGALMVCRIDDMVVDDTDYCSYGERKGGGDE